MSLASIGWLTTAARAEEPFGSPVRVSVVASGPEAHDPSVSRFRLPVEAVAPATAMPTVRPVVRVAEPVEVLPAPPPQDDLTNLFPRLEVTPIDLGAALALVDVRNPQFLLAQQRVLESMAVRQLAAAQFLPTINLGTSYDDHIGNLQQSSGNVINVSRSAMFVGAGANALAAGTVNIPGVMWVQNLADVTYNYLQSQQAVSAREFGTTAARNEMGLRVVSAYLDLLEAEGRRSIALKVRQEALELSRLTDAHARTGQGRASDAHRAATELIDREAIAVAAEGETLVTSSRLAQLLRLDPAIRLHPTDNWVVPHPLVPDPVQLPELLVIALTQRPELRERQAVVRQALLQLEGAQKLPFSPTFFLGYSSGMFGGGSNLVNAPPGANPFASGEPRFGSYAQRIDFDVIAYWTLKNVGLGNRAMIDAARARLSAADWQRLGVYEQVRLEVSNAHARSKTRLKQLQMAEEAMKAATNSYTEDVNRIRALEGLPIEVMDSLRLLAKARLAYLRAIVDYNRSQFTLYVSLGQPPADVLARPAEAVPGPNNDPAVKH
ncbi:MAG: TolC family protein [Planctomycetes bacterium]|nr:TolC family protein [Planctomycetota bacterium]